MNYFSKYRIDIALAVVLLVCALLPRVIGLGTFLTADEKTWLGRSYEFIRAFKDVRFNDMMQTTHPGVTTLWAAGTTITAKMFLSDVPFTNNTLFHFIKSSQFSIALLNTLAIPCFYILLLLVFKRRDVAFFAALLIAFDPFIIGYSRVVHVDALMGSFLTLSVLTSILYARSLSRTYLIASAVLAAFALLTKFPAVFIFPFILCALIAFYGKKTFVLNFLKDRSRDALQWVILVALLILIIWPALLWVPNPVGNVLQVKRDISIAAVTPHDMNEDYTLNAYHYPAALLSRSNPISLIGAIIGCVAIGVSFMRRKIPTEISLVALYLFGFVLMMTLGAKKGDRYILPVFFALDILAAYGILWIVSLRSTARIAMIRYGAIGLSAIYLLFVVVSYHPYAIAYSSPFFPDNISQELGWGEGLDQVATWLNTNHPNAVVASWYPGELGAFTTATVLHINAHAQNQVQYIVLYKNMFGREPAHYANDFIDEYYKKREPVFVARVAGKQFAWVYEKPSYSNTIGDLDSNTVVVQEVTVDHQDIAGIDFLPATHFGESKTGTISVVVSRTLQGESILTTGVPVSTLKDGEWFSIPFSDSLHIQKGEHLFISIHAEGTTSPYPSVRYARTSVRSTPIYISRTGSIQSAEEKPGSLGIRMLYKGIDGKIANELETKLLK